MRFPISRSKKFIVLILMACALSAFSFAGTPDDLSFSLTLTRGERSRDSNSRTTTITLNRKRLSYDLAYSGFNPGRRQPVHKEFEITAQDIETLKSLVRTKGLLKSGSLDLQEADRGHAYFAIKIKLRLDKRDSAINLSGPANATRIKDERLYKSSDALVKEVYRLIGKQDQEITYEELVN